MATIVKLSDRWIDLDSGRQFVPSKKDIRFHICETNGEESTFGDPDDIARLTATLNTMAAEARGEPPKPYDLNIAYLRAVNYFCAESVPTVWANIALGLSVAFELDHNHVRADMMRAIPSREGQS